MEIGIRELQGMRADLARKELRTLNNGTWEAVEGIKNDPQARKSKLERGINRIENGSTALRVFR